jgi:6-phosphofructokinase 1
MTAAARRFPPETTGGRIGLLTGGGDCPGLNAAIRALVKKASGRGLEVIGFLDGFDGLLEGRSVPLTYDDVSGILLEGGTILGSSTRPGPLTDAARAALKANEAGVAAMVVIGGDGTLTHARGLHAAGMPTVLIPKTIDNDVPGTDIAIGFASAVSIAAHAIDLLRSTARSHHRIMVVETMGREAGWLALAAGMAAGGDVIVIPEVPFDLNEAVAAVRRRMEKGRTYTLVIVAEGARGHDGEPSNGSPGAYLTERFGAVAESRLTVLGHLQRGGPPNVADRLLATALGAAAVDALLAGETGCLLAPTGGGIRRIPFAETSATPRLVPPAHPLLRQALDLGVVIPGLGKR